MTTIENSLFSFKKGNGNYILRNKAIVTLNYIISKIGCNNDLILIESGQLLTINDTKIFTVAKDGKYQIELNGTTVYFSEWSGHRQLLVQDVKRLLCDTCKGCLNGCNDGLKCLKNQGLFNNVLVYTNLIKDFTITQPQQYNAQIAKYIQVVINNNFCYVNREFCNQLFDTSIKGNSEHNQELFNYFIAVHYLAFYFYDKYNVSQTDIEALKYVDSIWDFKNIKRCLLNLGLCIGELEELYENEIPPIGPIITNIPVIYNGHLYNTINPGIDEVLLSYLPLAYNLEDSTLTNFNKLIENYTNSQYSASKIVFLNLPIKGKLKYNEEDIVINQEYEVNSKWVPNDDIQELVGNNITFKAMEVVTPSNVPINEIINYNIIDTNGNITGGQITINLIDTSIYNYDGYTTVPLMPTLTDINQLIELENRNDTIEITHLTKSLGGQSNDASLSVRLVKLSTIGQVLIKYSSVDSYVPMLDGEWYSLDKAFIVFSAPNQIENGVAVISYELRENINMDPEGGNITRNNFVYIPIQVNEQGFESGHISYIPNENVTLIQDPRLIGKTSIDGVSVGGVMLQDANIIFDPITGTIPDMVVYAGEKVIVFFTKNVDV